MKNKKIGFLIILTISVLSFLSPNAISSTTLEDSSVSVEEGEVYTWQWNYVSVFIHFLVYARAGDTLKLTIENIYRGAHQSINHALLMNITMVENFIVEGMITTTNRPTFVAYNKSLHYIKLYRPYIIPIPLNLTLIAEHYESVGENCTIEGNKLIFDSGVNQDEHTYNSDGILTEYAWISNNNLVMRMVLMEPSGGDLPLPLIIIAVVSIAGGIGVAGVSIILLRKKKRAREVI